MRLQATLLVNIVIFELVGSSSAYSTTYDERVERKKRAAVTWGEPVPDWTTQLQLGSSPFRYLYALLFVDDKIASYYGYDMVRVKQEVLKVVKEANKVILFSFYHDHITTNNYLRKYFTQLRIGVAVVDVIPTMRNDLKLHSFHAYRKERMHELPAHDFAALMTFRYAGGIAFVHGMCAKSVLMCGFYPHDPKAMGPIFFHEVAHLVGLPHKPINATVDVPNCSCHGQPGCLRIPGFDHDCTVQEMSNVLFKSKCVKTEPDHTQSTLPICGNGIVEAGEQCDCGSELVCREWNCLSNKCRHRVPQFYMRSTGVLFLSVAMVAMLASILRGCSLLYKWCHEKPPISSRAVTKKAKRYLNNLSIHSDLVRLGAEKYDPSTEALIKTKTTSPRPKIPPPPPPPRPTKSYYHITKVDDFDCESTVSSYDNEPGPSHGRPFGPPDIWVYADSTSDTASTQLTDDSESLDLVGTFV